MGTMDFETFDMEINDEVLNFGRKDARGFTYIAKSKDGLAFKVGFTRQDPSEREKRFAGIYKPFGFKITHLFKGNIERDLIWAFHISEATPAVPLTKPIKNREAYFFNSEEIEHVIKRCDFRPREEFGL